MTIAELIEELRTLDPNLHVFIPGYEGGYNDVSVSAPKDIALNVHDEWYYGSHEDAEYSLIVDKESYTIVKGIIL